MVQECLNHYAIHLGQGGHTGFLKLVSVSNKPSYIFSRHVGLVLDEHHCLRRLGKLREEERLDCLAEESVLSLFAIMIHAVSENGEINARLLKKQVILVMSVGIDKSHHASYHLHFLILLHLLQKWSSEHLFNETLYDILHGFLANFRKAHFLILIQTRKVSLIFSLVELIHCPKASSKEEKVELFRLFVTSHVRRALKRVKRVLVGDLSVQPFLTDGSLGCFKHDEAGTSSLEILLYHFFPLTRKLESLLVVCFWVLDCTVLRALRKLLLVFHIF